MAREYDGSGFWLNGAFIVAEIGVFVTALINWGLSSLTFGDPLVEMNYLQTAMGFGLALALLLIGLLVMGPFEPALPTTLVGALLAVTSAVAGVVALLQSTGAPDGDPGEVWWYPLQFFLWCPTNYPMFLVILAGLVRWLSAPLRRSQPVP
jgi:hypothetical protein